MEPISRQSAVTEGRVSAPDQIAGLSGAFNRLVSTPKTPKSLTPDMAGNAPKQISINRRKLAAITTQDAPSKKPTLNVGNEACSFDSSRLNSMTEAFNPICRNRTARIIQKDADRWLDNKTLEKKRKFFGLPDEGIVSAFETLKKQSKINLENIESALGQLTEVEQKIKSKIESCEVKYRHQTAYKLDKGGELKILSSALQETPRWQPESINNYLIFFAMEFAHRFTDTKPKKTVFDGIDFGPNAYFLTEDEVKKRSCFITLANILNQQVRRKTCSSDVKLPVLWKDEIYTVYKRETIFTPEDIRNGAALYLIKDIRSKENTTKG